jgi:restriction endonuclease S subunit
MKNPSLEIQEQCITLFEKKEAYIESIDKKIAEHKNYLEELKALAKDVITSFC